MTNRPPASVSCPSCGAHSTGKFCNQCGASLAVGACRSCGNALPAGARFCNECGTAVTAASGTEAGFAAAASSTSSGIAMYLPWGIAAALLLALVGYYAGKSLGGDSPAPATAEAGAAPFAPFANGGAGAGGAAPDISSMSPRERAGRLYDRIMRYVEQGKQDSAQFFAPMALSSFEMLGAELDLDARYDYGRVASETGNLPLAAAQADTILKQSPTHLLGLALAARTAAAQGNAKAAQSTWKLFLGARDAELKKNLPEYQAHAADIEQATKLAQGGK